jgi:ATP-dependent exoDNAse (exonuclease V) alpha subunit
MTEEEGTLLAEIIQESGSYQFVCNIGRNTPPANFLLDTDLIVVDEVSMLTPWVAERASRVLNWLAEFDGLLGGIQMLFVGDLLQLPPVVPNFGMPVGQMLISRARW